MNIDPVTGVNLDELVGNICFYHNWISNSGNGGQPKFSKLNGVYVMHAKCKLCNTRTWFTEEQWNALEES